MCKTTVKTGIYYYHEIKSLGIKFLGRFCGMEQIPFTLSRISVLLARLVTIVFMFIGSWLPFCESRDDKRRCRATVSTKHFTYMYMSSFNLQVKYSTWSMFYIVEGLKRLVARDPCTVQLKKKSINPKE